MIIQLDDYREPVDSPERTPYSFDISQPEPNGFVLVDACVPLELAVEFMAFLTNWKPAAEST